METISHKLGLAILGSLVMTLAQAQSQVSAWIDVTDTYIQNARYEQNNGDHWEGTELGFTNAMHNAEHYNKTYDTYQKLTGLTAGKYRLSISGFYRAGDASTDYGYVNPGWGQQATNTYRYARMYATSSVTGYTISLPYLGSAALEQSLGGNTTTVSEGGGGGWWGWGWGTKYYVPNDMEAAHYWFEAGYYYSTLNNILVGDDGELTIGIKKTSQIDSDWTCFSNWKLEFYGQIDVATEADIKVNELMPANLDLFIDPSWNFGGFAEFHNETDKTISLSTCYLSDDSLNLKKWHIPTNEMFHILPNGYCTIWFDHSDQYCNTQANFKLDVDGGTLYLSDPDGNLLLAQEYPEAVRRCSYARKTDGSDEWGWTANATPGATNNGSKFATEQLPAPVVNRNGQVFDNSLSVKVTIPAGATLRYTTDGSVPTADNGEISKTGTFSVTKTTVYRFRLFKDGYLPSDITTRSYISHKNYVQSGWSGSEKTLDFCVPILSIVTDDRNVYGDDWGIFVEGNGNGRPGRGSTSNCNWNMDWDRPANMEYFADSKEVSITQEVNMSAVGGWSRAWTPHSFKLKANKQYGLKYMPYAFFTDKPYNKNKTLQIRNGGNDNTCRIIDPAVQEIIARSGINVDCQSYVPTMVFINGEYYEVLNMREPNNKHWAYANRGIDDDEMDQFEMSPDSGYIQMEGTKEMFTKWYNLTKQAADSASYEEIKKIVDIDEYINYMALEFWLGGTDWPQNNIKGYRPRTEGGKFRFVVFDLDFAFNTTTPFSTFAGKQNYTYDELHGKGIEGQHKRGEIEFVTIFLNMLNNDEFRKQFIDTYCIVSGSVFEPTRCKAIITELADRATAAMSQSGGSPSSSATKLKNGFSASKQKSAINTMKSYAKMKLTSTAAITSTLSANIDEARILINDLPVPTNKFSGQLFPPIKIKAQAPAGFKFIGWKSGNEIICEDEEYELPKTGTTTLVATYEKLSDEEMLAANYVPVRINEVSASNTMASNDLFKREDWIELYNTTDNPIDIAGMYISDKKKNPLKYQFQKSDSVSTTIQPHSYIIVWCDKSEAVSQLHTNFKLGNDDESCVILTAEDGSWADTLSYNAHSGEMSYGRYPDGSNNVYLMNMPTTGKANILCTNDSLKYGSPIVTDIEYIEEPATEVQNNNNEIYDLTGRKISNTSLPSVKGIYIRNGKKYLIK